MGTNTYIKLWFRGFLLLIITYLLLLNYDLLIYIAYYQIFNFIPVYKIFWLFLMWEMFKVLIPILSKYTYSGKHFLKHFKEIKDHSIHEFVKFHKENRYRAIRSAVFWVVINLPFIVLFYLGYIDNFFMYWLAFFYYFVDVLCINVFCVFHLFITRNKCCNECRIYNWGHFMYCTPLIFIPNFWTTSLVILSLIVLIQWEISYALHPERFSSVTNMNLQCNHCPNDCRFRKNRHIDKIINYLVSKSKKL